MYNHPRRWSPAVNRECLYLGARAGFSSPRKGAIDRQWAYNGTTCARLGPCKISVLLWLDSLQLALHCAYNIDDGKHQGLCLRISSRAPSSSNPTKLPALRCAAEHDEATFANYAAALVACQTHYVATHPKRHPSNWLRAALDSDRADCPVPNSLLLQ